MTQHLQRNSRPPGELYSPTVRLTSQPSGQKKVEERWRDGEVEEVEERWRDGEVEERWRDGGGGGGRGEMERRDGEVEEVCDVVSLGLALHPTCLGGISL